MSSKIKINKDFFIIMLLTSILTSLLLLVPIYNLGYSNKQINNNSDSIVMEAQAETNEFDYEIPENMELVSKTVIDDKYTNILLHSILPEEINVYESHIIDNGNGKEIDLSTLIKENKLEEFWSKAYELLEIKYPKFIVDAIKTNDGNKAYLISENEMVIYFINYPIVPEINELITLKINYNEVKNYLNFTFRLDKEYTNEDGYNYKMDKKTVALTFDDGPSGEKTKSILNLLSENKAHASFFMVGNRMINDQNTVKMVYDSGNEIGSHTYEHGNLSRQSKQERADALSRVDEIYEKITGDEIHLLRPPYGAYKKDMLNEFNYSVVLWNIDTEDWRYRDVDRIIKTVTDNLNDGSIILMHDTYNTTVEAVRKLLPILYSNGYQVVSVSELAKLKDIDLEKNTAYRRIVGAN